MRISLQHDLHILLENHFLNHISSPEKNTVNNKGKIIKKAYCIKAMVCEKQLRRRTKYL